MPGHESTFAGTITHPEQPTITSYVVAVSQADAQGLIGHVNSWLSQHPGTHLHQIYDAEAGIVLVFHGPFVP